MRGAPVAWAVEGTRHYGLGLARHLASRGQHVEGIDASRHVGKRRAGQSDAIHAVRGLRAPGTGVPGLVAVGTFRASGKKIFAIVHHDNRRGVRLRFTGADYDEVIAGCDDPEDVVARLTAAPGR